MVKNIKRILMIGSIKGQAKQRMQALQRLGYEVDAISETAADFAPGLNYKPTFIDRVFYKLGYPRDKMQVNKRAIHAVTEKSYDLIWIEKCLCLKPDTLVKIKKIAPTTILLWYSGDDMMARHNQSAYFRRSISMYDYVITTKSYNCAANELPSLGAKNILFVDKGFDTKLHKPVTVDNSDVERLGSDVGFIGTYERERAEMILFLAKNGISVRVWGNGWNEFAKQNPVAELKIECKPIYDQDYQKSICATKINLCFLRKINRDLQTDRTMELPAFAAFMLAERTDEHRRLFEEGVEAAYFDDDKPKELLEKVRYYLKYADERQMIAERGYQRCYRSGYSHEHRLQQIFAHIME